MFPSFLDRAPLAARHSENSSSIPFTHKYSIYRVLSEGLRKKVSFTENVGVPGVMLTIVNINSHGPHDILRMVASSLF